MTQIAEEKKYWVWMASMPEITPKAFYHILTLFGCAASFFNAVVKGSELLDEVPKKIVTAAKSAASKQYIAEILSEHNRKGITTVTRLCKDFPVLLAEIKFPPPVLFVKGSLENTENCVSIVGTRRPTRHAMSFTEKLAKELCEADFTVVSGMAYGIDAAAHRGALQAGGNTIAVLGCGVDVIYPRDNEDIYNETAQVGAVVSELPIGTQPLYTNFPARNRIVTGMSEGTIIVESELKGGTAISARLAVSQGRDVFAVPGMNRMSELPNMLIKKGAVPITSAEDILAYYGRNSENIETSHEQSQIQLDFLQRHIYNLLLKGDLSVESISDSIEYTPGEISASLTMMELSGLVKRLPGGKYGI